MAKKESSISQQFISLIKLTYTNWRNDRTLRLGAGLSYYVVFSLVPMIAISAVIASLLFPTEEIAAYFQEQALLLFGTSASDVAAVVGESLKTETVSNAFVSLGIFGLAALVVTASFAMIALQDSVSMIWGRPVQKGIHNTVRRYAFSYITVLSIALMLVIVLTVQAVVDALENLLNLDGPLINALSNTFTTAVSWALLVFALAWLIRILTEKRVAWKHAVFGSAITVFFMYLGVLAIGLYFTTFGLVSVTSAFGAVLLVLAWVYYESQILLAGFQLTKTLSEGKYHYEKK